MYESFVLGFLLGNTEWIDLPYFHGCIFYVNRLPSLLKDIAVTTHKDNPSLCR